MDRFAEVLGSFAQKLSLNRYISTIKDSFIETIPFTVLGSIGVLLGSVVFSTTGLGGIKGFEFLLEWAPWFNQLNYATMNILALIIAFNIGKNLAITYGHAGIYEGLLSLVCFILVSPTSVTAIFGEETQVVGNVLSTDVTSSKGLFVAMIVGLVSINLFCRLSKVKRLRITLPDAVPPNVAKTFSDLLPTIIVGFVVSGFAFAFEYIFGQNISLFIFEMLQAPITVAFEHPLGIIFAAFFAALLWLCGLHGASIVTGITTPIMLASLQTNMDLVAQGKEATEIMAKPFWNLFATQGGFGCTFALLIAIFIISKREDDKTIAKLSLAPSFFGINEPVIFGLPIVMNPIMAIPFILVPIVCCGIGYAAMSLGFAGLIISDVPWCFPPVINGFIATGGSIGMVVTQLICIIVSVFIWMPFVKMRNSEVIKK
jgi:PTS system cellobiose-specific IIC component